MIPMRRSRLPSLGLLLLIPAVVCGQQAPPAKEKPIELEPMKIHEKPIIAFAVATTLAFWAALFILGVL